MAWKNAEESERVINQLRSSETVTQNRTEPRLISTLSEEPLSHLHECLHDTWAESLSLSFFLSLSPLENLTESRMHPPQFQTIPN